MTPILHGEVEDTGVPHETLKHIGLKINDIPKEFNIHP